MNWRNEYTSKTGIDWASGLGFFTKEYTQWLERELSNAKTEAVSTEIPVFISMENEIMAFLRERKIPLHGERTSLQILIDYTKKMEQEGQQ